MRSYAARLQRTAWSRSPERRRSLRKRRDRADADVLAVEELQPLGERPRLEDGGELGCELLLPLGIELASGELGPLDQLAQPPEELRLERPDRQVPSVCGRVDPVAGEAAREEARERITAQPVRDEAVRAVRHRDRQPGAATCARALEQCREDFGDRPEGACCEVRRLNRRQPRRGVFEHARPAEVVQVVTCASRMRPLGSESRDRAIDRRLGGVVRADAEPLGHARPEAFEDHVCAGEQGLCERQVSLQVDRDRLLAGVQRFVPGSRDTTHRVAVRLLEPHDSRPEP